jgi:predicted DNA binding CopG/RHH family protein
MSEKELTNEELAREAERWDKREVHPSDWEDAPELVPRAGESVAVSIRLPKQMLILLKEFAGRKGIGYQVLMKRWLDDRIRDEYAARTEERFNLKLKGPKISSQAAGFDPKGVDHLTEDDTLDEFGRLAKLLHSRKLTQAS